MDRVWILILLHDLKLNPIAPKYRLMRRCPIFYATFCNYPERAYLLLYQYSNEL